jgi:hypothetical protein
MQGSSGSRRYRATTSIRSFGEFNYEQGQAILTYLMGPESHQRTTQWVEPSRAIAMIKEADLKRIVATFAKRAAAAASRAAF